MQRLVLGVLIAAALWLTACGAGDPAGVGVSTSRGDELPPTVATSDPAQLYEGDATVLEAEEGPMLCLGGAMPAIYPPQCGDLPVTNWDWAAVEGEESDMGVTWGDFHVVGTLEGEAFTVTEVGPSDPGEEDYGTYPDFTSPCPEPAGGWVDIEPGLASERDFERGSSRARRLPDFVVLWVRYVGNPTPEEMEQFDLEGKPYPQRIVNVIVTDDAGAAEGAIREVWGGPLCVTRREGHTEKELMAIRAEAERWLEEEVGLQMTWSQEGPLGRGAAEVGVWIDPGGAGQAALDGRYGPGMVRLFPALRPVE